MRVDATFCGQCGHNLKAMESKAPILLSGPVTLPTEPANVGLPPTVLTVPAAELAELAESAVLESASVEPDLTVLPIGEEVATPLVSTPVAPFPVTTLPLPELNVAVTPVSTQLQIAVHQLLHIQTNTSQEIPPQLQIVHLGKPNDQIPPDIDVSGFPSAEVVSRIHANIRVEGESYYIEDIGSANGTYINHNILPKGNRHLLRTGDRIGLGKGDLVTFIFQ
jgi:FHA domain